MPNPSSISTFNKNCSQLTLLTKSPDPHAVSSRSLVLAELKNNAFLSKQFLLGGFYSYLQFEKADFFFSPWKMAVIFSLSTSKRWFNFLNNIQHQSWHKLVVLANKKPGAEPFSMTLVKTWDPRMQRPNFVSYWNCRVVCNVGLLPHIKLAVPSFWSSSS